MYSFIFIECLIFILFMADTTPPLVECPTQVHRQHYAGNSSHIPLVLPLDVVSSWDFSGISHKVFSPSLGTLVPVLQELSITVTVFDFFGNSANCSFVYFIESKYSWFTFFIPLTHKILELLLFSIAFNLQGFFKCLAGL